MKKINSLLKPIVQALFSEMENMKVKLKMSRKFSKFWKEISTFSNMENTPLPKSTVATLREYQAKGYSWLWFLYKYGLNGILADDMGLGKTLQTLTLLQKAKEKDGKKTSLVICPTSVVFNWENEIEKFAPNLKFLNLTGVERHSKFKNIENMRFNLFFILLKIQCLFYISPNDFNGLPPCHFSV